MTSKCHICRHNAKSVGKKNKYFCSLNHKDIHSDSFNEHQKQTIDKAINCSDFFLYQDSLYTLDKRLTDNSIYKYENNLPKLLPLNQDYVQEKGTSLDKYDRESLLTIYLREEEEYNAYMYFYKSSVREIEPKFKSNDLTILHNLITYRPDKDILIGKVVLELSTKDNNSEKSILEEYNLLPENMDEIGWLNSKICRYINIYNNLLSDVTTLLDGMGIKCAFLERRLSNNEGIYFEDFIINWFQSLMTKKG